MPFHVWHMVCKGETTHNRESKMMCQIRTGHPSAIRKDRVSGAMGMRVGCVFLHGVWEWLTEKVTFG